MSKIIKRKIYTLDFSDHADLAGAVVRARSVSLGKLLDVADLADRARAGAGLAEVRALLDLFCSRLVSWDLEDEDDGPVPATMDGLLSLDPDVALAIVLSWFDVMVDVPDPLERKSTAGSTFPEVSIPMDIPSPNLANSGAPA